MAVPAIKETSPRRRLGVVVSALVAIVLGTTALAAPAEAAYRPEVKLSAYTVHRGHADAALLRHFLARHRGTLTTRNHHHTVQLQTFRTDRSGGALFGFIVPKRLTLGTHKLVFRTGSKVAVVRIRVRR
jgi:hypothetical protein